MNEVSRSKVRIMLEQVERQHALEALAYRRAMIVGTWIRNAGLVVAVALLLIALSILS